MATGRTLRNVISGSREELCYTAGFAAAWLPSYDGMDKGQYNDSRGSSTVAEGFGKWACHSFCFLPWTRFQYNMFSNRELFRFGGRVLHSWNLIFGVLLPLGSVGIGTFPPVFWHENPENDSKPFDNLCCIT
jgi:hypothetical protein